MNYKVTIKEITPIGESTEGGADVRFELSGREFIAFSYPCTFTENTEVKTAISFLEEELSEDTFWNENESLETKILQSEYDSTKYYCFGVIESVNPNLIVNCGDISFEVDWGFNDNSFIGKGVYFVISRMDIESIEDT